MTHQEDLIAAIYEASVATELWPKVLERLSHVAGCYGATLATVDPVRKVRFVATDSLQSFMEVFVRDGWMPRNSRAARLAPKRYAGFVTDLDLFTKSELRIDPFYVEFLRPNGGGWGTGTIINVPCGDTAIFNLERAHKDGPVSTQGVKSLDALRPHLARASVLSARLALEKARAMTNVLRSIGLAGAVLGNRGHLIAANAEFERLIGEVFQDRRERLTLRNHAADNLLVDGLKRIFHGSFSATLSIPIPVVEEQRPVIMHVVPVRGVAHDIFAKATAILYMTPFGRNEMSEADILAALFDLTPAEARVASQLVDGRSLEHIAGRSGRSRETVRTHIKSVFRKTGTTRQAELVALLAARTFR